MAPIGQSYSKHFVVLSTTCKIVEERCDFCLCVFDLVLFRLGHAHGLHEK